MVLVALLASPLATPGSVALAQDATPTSASAPAVDAEPVLPVDEMPEPTVAPDVPPTEAPIAPTFEATVEPTMAPTVETAPDPTPTATMISTVDATGNDPIDLDEAAIQATPHPQFEVGHQPTAATPVDDSAFPKVQLADGVSSVTCGQLDPPQISRGASATITCLFDPLLLDVNLGRLLRTEFTVTQPEGIEIEVTGPQGCRLNAVLSVCVLEIDLGVLPGPLAFQVEIAPQCTAAVSGQSQDIRFSATSRLLGISLGTHRDTIAFQVTNSNSQIPVVAVNGDSVVSFGHFEWNGERYAPGSGSSALGVTISPPSTGCLNSGSTVQIGSTKPLTNGSYTIENTHIGISAEGNNFGWGSSQAISENLGSTHTIFETSSVDATTAEPVELELNLSLSPPPDAPPGDYEGTITITSYPSGAPGE